MDGLLGEGGRRGHPHLDITSRAFQSKKYIQRVIANVTYAIFEGRLVDEVGEAEEHTGEALKQLIRDNLGVFIDSKDAMETVYHADAELFTGEALDHITSSFEGASMRCESLVKPITETYLEMQKARKSSDMLNRFFSVLSVPGAIYESCGVRVAQRRQRAAAMEVMEDDSTSSALDDDDVSPVPGDAGMGARTHAREGPPHKASGRAMSRAAPSNDNGDEGGMGREQYEAEDEEEEGDGARDGTAADASTARVLGTLEIPADSTAAADVYILSAGEEIHYWCDTPLVRLADFRARRQHVERVANYEAAVLHLRRAMLYIEETYSLIDGTTLTGDDGESSKAAQVSPSPGEGRRLSVGQDASTTSAVVGDTAKPSLSLSSVGRSLFAKQFSMALLRASLYLCNQLAEELVYADPADTVLIEDTLSMMMDASIASVKLHHFCGVLHEALGDRDGHGQVLTKLRTQLSTSRTAVETLMPMAGGITAAAAESFPRAHAALPTGGAGEHSSSASPNRSISEAGTGGAAAASAAPPRTAPRRDTATYQHPAQFFISVVQRQQKQIFYSSAAAILREAEGWLRKAQTEAARNVRERQRQQELRRPVTSDGHAGGGTAEDQAGKGGDHGYTLLSNSFIGTGFDAGSGFIGNVNDSFLQDSSWTKTDTLGATGQRQSSADSPTAGDGRGGAGIGGSTTDESRKSVGFAPDANVWKVLDAFNTPESPFPTNTEFRLGKSDMDAVLVASCEQIRMHSSFLLTQLFTRADVEAAVMAQAGHLDTFALRLCAECVGTLEHVVSSYWGGIATTLHSGAFDFAPEVGSPLHVILAQLFDSTGAKASTAAGGAAAAVGGGGGIGDNVFQRLPSALPNGVHSRTMSHTWETGDGYGSSGPEGPASSRAVVGDASTDQLPAIRFIPALPHAFRTAAANGGGTPATEQLSASMRLRDISVQAVHRMISGAMTTLQALFLAYINRSVVDGFVSTLAQYQTSDLRLHSRTERIELHAAILYEIILAQWERMMSLVSGAVLRLKIVVGESSNSSTVTSEMQVKEIEDLLQELELLRTTSLRCYLHGVGVLSKAYLMALPLLKGHTDTSLDARVRTRLSRESVSSNAVHQLLNLLSVVMDRCVSFFMRDKEVYDSVDLFAVKSESLGNDADEDAGRNKRSEYGVRDDPVRRRGRLQLRRRLGGGSSGDKGHGNGLHAEHDGQGAVPPAPTSPGDGIGTFIDPVSELIAQFHSRLVMESLQDHEELVLALLSHLLLAFVDMQQLKGRTVMTDVTLHPDQRERCVVECMADTLCLATTLTPILMENLLIPCLFEVIARQLPVLCATPADVAAMLQSKQQQYMQVYLSVVEEHAQLAVDAMMNTYLAVTEQPITDLIRRQGFVQPLFDWQRISPQTAAAVRPYIADAIACIARAHETLNVIRQPVLSSAATQRLVAHLVRTFVGSFTSDVNLFELSVECSSSFLVHGLTLLGAEATTILRFVDSVVAHVAAKPTTNELLPELVMARESLSALTQTLDSFTTSVCEAIVSARNVDEGNTSSEFIALVFLSRDKRQERREGMVQAAMHTLRYMLDAINTELEESSLSSVALLQLRSATDAGAKGDSAGSGGSRGAVAERIVQRIEQRKKGYELRRSRAAAAAQGKAESQDAEKRRAVQERGLQRKAPEDGADASGGLDGVASPGSRRQQLRRTLDAQRQSSTSAGQHGDSGDAQAGGGFSPHSPQDSERESWKAAEEAGDVYQLAQGQRQRHRVRRTRRADAANSVNASDEAVVVLGAAAAGARLASPTPAAVAGPLPSASLADNAAAGNEDSAEAPLSRVPRRARRRVACGGESGGGDGGDGGAADGAVTRHERRARRFGRTNALQ